MGDRLAAREAHIRRMPRRSTPLLQGLRPAVVTHRYVFSPCALRRPLLKAGMVQALYRG
jgi:hypothetical protein